MAWQDPNNESRSIQNNSELLEPEKFVTPGVREGIHTHAGCNHWCGPDVAAADVLLLGKALGRFNCKGKTDLLSHDSCDALKHVWKAQQFSWWMTQTLHRFPGENPFDYQRQLTDLEYLTGSKAAMTSLAENYVGLPLEVSI